MIQSATYILCLFDSTCKLIVTYTICENALTQGSYGIYSAVFLYKVNLFRRTSLHFKDALSDHVSQARSFGMMLPSEEAEVQGLVARTTEVLKRASAGPDDIGARYSRLLELLWRPKPHPVTNRSAEQREPNEFSIPTALSNPVSDPTYMDFSPAHDFSWLDLEAVGDYVSGDQPPGGLLGLDVFQNEATPYPGGHDRSQVWQSSAWLGDMSSNLLF